MAYEDIPFSGAFLDENAAPLSGAAPTITIVNSAGTPVVTGAATTEISAESGALYLYVYTPTVQSTYTGVMSTSDPDATQSWLLVGSEVARDDSGGGGGATAQEIWEYGNRTLTSSTQAAVISFYNPQRQLWELVIGDSYTSGDDDGALDVESDNFPVLTGGSILVTARHRDYADMTFSKAGSVVSARKARLEITAAESALLIAGLWDVRYRATLADGTKRTLVKGVWDWQPGIPGEA